MIPSLEGWSTKAKKASDPNDPTGHHPSIAYLYFGNLRELLSANADGT